MSINHSEITHNFKIQGQKRRDIRTSDTGVKKKDTDKTSSDKAILEYYNTQKAEGKKPSIDFPVDIIEYANDAREMPSFFGEVEKKLEEKGFSVLQHTPDHFKVDICKSKKKCELAPDTIHVYHSPYRHFVEITLPKLELLASKNPNIRGFFVAEGDVCPIDKFNLTYFLKNYPINEPIWLGWKKVQRAKGEISYVVGNFLLYFPVEFLPVLRKEVDSKKGKLMYSDRFFTQLVQKGLLKLQLPDSMAGEVEHYSKVAGGKTRKKARGEEECDIKAGKPNDTIRAQQLKVYGDNPVSKEKHTGGAKQVIPDRFITKEGIKKVQGEFPSKKIKVKGFGIKEKQKPLVMLKKQKAKPKKKETMEFPIDL